MRALGKPSYNINYQLLMSIPHILCVCVCVCVCLVAGQNQATCDCMVERSTAQLSCTKTPACNRADCTPSSPLLRGYSLSIELLSCRTPPGMIHTNYTVSVVLSIMMNVLLGVCIEVIHCACCINKTRINQPRETVNATYRTPF